MLKRGWAGFPSVEPDDDLASYYTENSRNGVKSLCEFDMK